MNIEDFDSVVSEGKNSQDWSSFLQEVRDALVEANYTKQERKEYMRKLKATKSGKNVLEALIDQVNSIASHPGGSDFTVEDMKLLPAAKEAKPTDKAKTYPEEIGILWNTWEKTLAGMDLDYPLPWLKTLVANLKFRAALKTPTLKISEPFHPYADVDLRKYSNRKEYYKFWKGISEQYNAEIHHDFLDAFKEIVSDARLLRKIEKLKKLNAPPMTAKVPPVPFFGEYNRQNDVIDAFLKRINSSDDGILFTTGGYHQREEEGGKFTGQVVGEMDITEDEELRGDAEAALKDLQKYDLDPLLWRAIQEKKVAVPFTTSNFNEKQLKSGVKEALVQIDEDLWTEFEDFVKELKESVGPFENMEFHLPLSDSMAGDLGELRINPDGPSEEGKGPRDVIADREEFFELLGDIITARNNQFHMQPHGVKTGMGDTESHMALGGDKKAEAQWRGEIKRTTEGQAFPKIEGKERELGTAQSEYDELEDALMKYYFEPTQSDYFYEEKPRFLALNQFKNILLRQEKSPMARRLKRTLNANVENFDTDDVDKIITFLEEFEQVTEDVTGRHLRLAKDAVSGCNAILGRDVNNKASIGKMLGIRAQFRGQDLENLPFQGENLDHWVKSKSTNVLNELHDFFESTPIKANLNLRDTTKPIQNALIIELYRGDKDSPEAKKFNAVKKLVSMIVDLKKSELDPVSIKLLHAHDMIRKMTGKKLSYGILNIDNPNHISILMEKVSVTANEISNIVKSYDSHRNLSLKYGISEDDIYKIKGLCR